jgi:DNA polymerase-3 subunit alpha
MNYSAAGFADLRVHSNYSYRDGVCTVEELVQRAVELGRPALALTDHGHAAGFIELQEAADKYGLANPIFGVDMALNWPEKTTLVEPLSGWANESCGAEAERLVQGGKGGRCYNMVLLAQDQQGLHNLFDLLTWAGTKGYDANNEEGPRLDENILKEQAQGLVLLSGGPGGKLSRLLAADREAEAEQEARQWQEVFGSNFFIELLAQEAETVKADRARLIPFAKRLGLPLLATSDVHYIHPEQVAARDLLWAIADNVRLNDPKRRRPVGNDARFLELAELERIFSEVPEALENAARLADQCRVRLPKASLIIPDFPVPTEFGEGETGAGRYLAEVARRNLIERYGKLSSEMEQRLDYELSVIARSGFSQYILIVADIMREARRQEILCAPRGSSAGSLVCFAVGITPLNPLDYGLLFERFLNEARLAPPDIDLDIADEARPRLLDYVVRRYGAENVAHIITHNFEGAKSALRDAGKALGTDPFLVNRLVSLVPIEFQRPWTLGRTIVEEAETAKLYKKDKAAQELLDHALLIEGTGRNSGTHAAGVVITPRPIAEYAPLTRTQGLAQRQREESRDHSLEAESDSGPTQINVMTQWDMEGVEKRGLLKIDLLGLTAWSTIGHCLRYMQQTGAQLPVHSPESGVQSPESNINDSTQHSALSTQHSLDVWRLPTDDAETFKTISQGYTIGIFQLEKQGMTEFTMAMKPKSIQDLALMIAAYRPGPMPFLNKLIQVRYGREPLETPHPLLNPIMAETYGVPIYQETMLKIAREVAGYSLGEADALRKSIGKKLQKELVAHEKTFTEGAMAHGLTREQAAAVWQMFPPFAFYGFNQAHAIIYGYLTYITAYLKVHYPLEYMAALLTVAGGDTEAIIKAASECRRLGVPLLGPDVNRSNARISLDKLPEGGWAIRFGLAAIKGIGPAAVEAILAARREGPFTGLVDFIRRVPGRSVNSRGLAALIKVGAFPFGNRAQLEAALPEAQKAAKSKKPEEIQLKELEEYPLETLLASEYEALGVHITPVPVAEMVAQLEKEGRVNATTATLTGTEETARLAGIITGGREVKSNYGLMYTFNLNDGRGLLEVNVFPKLYRESASLLKEGKLILVEGKPQLKEGRVRVQAQKLEGQTIQPA